MKRKAPYIFPVSRYIYNCAGSVSNIRRGIAFGGADKTTSSAGGPAPPKTSRLGLAVAQAPPDDQVEQPVSKLFPDNPVAEAQTPRFESTKCNYKIAQVNQCRNIRDPSLAVGVVVDVEAGVEARNIEVGAVEVEGAAGTIRNSRNGQRKKTFSI